MNRKTSIAPGALQAVLDSAANAAQKGQAQWHTPTEWGAALALPLSQLRPNLVDFTCGNGQLLRAGAKGNSKLFGVEIEPFADAKDLHPVHRITADVTKLPALFKAVGFVADGFVLNLPWDTHWFRDRLTVLAESTEPAVQAAFRAHDGRTTRDTIDSTVAGFCLALEFGTYQSEGFIIANHATVERLITGPHAPHRALAQHVWAHLIIEGNICAPETKTSNFQLPTSNSSFQTSVLYFANSHTDGVQAERWVADFDAARLVLRQWKTDRIELRRGDELSSWNLDHNKDIATKWQAVAEEWERLQDTTKSQWNIWLGPDGTVQTALSLFDNASGRLKDHAAKLHELNGKRPRQLVMQMQQRKALLAATAPSSPWRVEPALVTAVEQAVTEYGAKRAPMTALNPIQRLAYLDEIDVIECRADLGEANPLSSHRSGVIPMFRAGGRYAIRTTTVMVKRQGRKMNMAGEYDDVQWDGQELAIYVRDEEGSERLFMEGRLRHEQVKVSVIAPDQIAAFKRLGVADVVNPCAIDFTLHELVDHFHIPEVLDVAALNPKGHQRNLDLMKQMEKLLNN